MSSKNLAIRTDGLGKAYRIGQGQTYGRLTESVANVFRATLRRSSTGARASSQPLIWAVRNVSLEVAEGEVVGFIGRNGAGKTTLLKILSRITEPTEGTAELRGRAGTLLEVGTGFHPELTGRENIFLNGAILGMRKAQIERRFDEIVEFAGVERFIDTPVKRYSSGMYVRLAFAVAAHLEPEILIVDEVLAVGDAEFQKKCLGKMGDVAREGRTVLFVSHNMQAVRSLCTRVVYLADGTVVADGPVGEIVEQYLAEQAGLTAERMWAPGARPGEEPCRLAAVRLLDEAGRPTSSLFSSKPAQVELEVELSATPSNLCVGFDLLTSDGITVFRSFHTDVDEQHRPPLQVGHNVLRCAIPPGLLNAGTYGVAPRVSLHLLKWLVNLDPVVQFDVIFDHGRSHFLNAMGTGVRPGPIAPVLDWTSAPTAARLTAETA